MKLNPPKGCDYDILAMLGMNPLDAKILTTKWADMADEVIEKEGHYCLPKVMARGINEMVNGERELFLFMWWLWEVDDAAEQSMGSASFSTTKLIKAD